MHLYTADSNFCLVVVWDFSSCAKYKMISCGKPKGTNKRKTETKHWGGYFIPSQVWMQLGWFIIRCVCVCVSRCAPRFGWSIGIGIDQGIPTRGSSFLHSSPVFLQTRHPRLMIDGNDADNTAWWAAQVKSVVWTTPRKLTRWKYATWKKDHPKAFVQFILYLQLSDLASLPIHTEFHSR